MKVPSCVALCSLLLLLTQAIWAETAKRDYWPTEEWKSVAPETVGFDGDRLSRIDEDIAFTLPLTSSILIVRNGYLVHEKYFKGDADSLRVMASETKSVMSILIGILIKGNKLLGVDQEVLSLLPELRSESASAFAEKITVRHLLTMSSGLPDDGGVGVETIDQMKALLSKAQEHKPGEVFQYNGTNANLLSLLVSRLTGQRPDMLAKATLFKSLGIVKYYWQRRRDLAFGAYGLSLTSRDIAKIGYLYLNKGVWAGEEIVPAEWVDDCTSSKIATGNTIEEMKNYGYFWWVGSTDKYRSYFAVGFGGQAIAVVPELDLVQVITTEDTTNFSLDRYISILKESVIPALR